MYGITDDDIVIAHEYINKARQYPENNFIVIAGRRITLDKMSKQLLINPLNFLEEMQHRFDSFQKWSQKRDLCEVVIVLTHPRHTDSFHKISEYFKLQMKQIRQTKAWKTIPKYQRAYFHVKEPHQSGIMHMNVVFFLPAEHIEDFLSMLQKKYQHPQIHIFSSYLPNGYLLKNEEDKSYEKNGLPGFVVKPDKSMVPYITKNIQKLADEVEDLDKLSFLATWYIVKRVRIFGSSQTFASIQDFHKVKRYFSLNEFTDMVNENKVQLWKPNNTLYMITQGEKVLWIKQNYKIYNESSIKYVPKSKATEIPPKEHILAQGKITTKIKYSGILEYEIEITSSDSNDILHKENQQQSNNDYNEIIKEINELRKEVKNSTDSIETLPTKIVTEIKKFLKKLLMKLLDPEGTRYLHNSKLS
jgi:DNA-binding transcriptional regulator GbsR (MarR family)